MNDIYIYMHYHTQRAELIAEVRKLMAELGVRALIRRDMSFICLDTAKEAELEKELKNLKDYIDPTKKTKTKHPQPSSSSSSDKDNDRPTKKTKTKHPKPSSPSPSSSGNNNDDENGDERQPQPERAPQPQSQPHEHVRIHLKHALLTCCDPYDISRPV
jgi:hypothetical protein